jgi:hypothetical protein
VFLQSKKEARKQGSKPASLTSRTLFVNCFFSFEVKTKKEKQKKKQKAPRKSSQKYFMLLSWRDAETEEQLWGHHW